MNAAQRRQEIERLLQQADHPLSAGSMASRFMVSRQIIVGDIALLRASGTAILATPRGYVLERPCEEAALYFERSLVCVHNDTQIAEEIYTIVDYGGALLDVTVEHPIYGEICAPLRVFSRFDADCFLNKLKASGSKPLSGLTDGVHLHRIRCANEEVFLLVQQALQQRGLLYENQAATE